MKLLKPVLLFCLWLHCVYCCEAGVPVLPQPQQCSTGKAGFSYNPSIVFKSNTADNATVGRLQRHWSEFSAEFNDVVKKQPSIYSLILLGSNSKEDATLNKFISDPHLYKSIGGEGYILIANDSVKIIAANSETGLFYGMQSLRQLTRAQFNQSVLITDWPEFKHRVVMDDISRGPISTIDFIKYQIRRLAEIKINYLTFYIEHVIQTVSHPDIAPANGKLTVSDIRKLSDYAAGYHMQLIGSFQSFGHFEKILALPAYQQMGATSNLIDPDNPKAKQFLSDVIGEMCDAFSAPWFNVNCDETFDLGKGKSGAGVDSLGIAAYYAKHIRFLNSIVQKHKKKLMLWGDIAIQHVEILDLLPKDLTWLTWEYGTPASFDKWIKPFSKRGLPFMVCPGILNSNRLFPDHEMAVKNIAGFAKAGKESGALGVFTTIWDEGSAYLFAGVWYSVYKAAEKSWNLKQDADNDFDSRYCINAFDDTTEKYTKMLHQLLQLRKLPLTWNMNDQLWTQSLLPEKGRSILFCNADLETARAIVTGAWKFLETNYKRNMQDVLALQLASNQYATALLGRMLMPAYTNNLPGLKTSGMQCFRQSDFDWIELMFDIQQVSTREAGLRFKEYWLAENQEYWLDKALQPYNERQMTWKYLSDQLPCLFRANEKNITVKDSCGARISVFQSVNRYFQNWLLCGPFNSADLPSTPFLYFPGESTVTKPKPGDQFRYAGKDYRWKKFASPTGGITYLEDVFKTGIKATDWVYAFATLQHDSAGWVQAYLGADKNAQVFCNGQLITLQPQAAKELSIIQAEEMQLQLPLIKGINYLVIKLPGNTAEKAFTFRLHPSVIIANHKHKYYLNPNTSDHEAE